MSRTSACATSARRTTRIALCTRRWRSSNAPPVSGVDDTPETKLHKLEALLAPTSSPICGTCRSCRVATHSRGDLYAPRRLNPHRKKEETFEALLRQLVVSASSQPVLMVFEDVHWIDPSSRELLDRVVRSRGRPACAAVDYLPARVSAAMDRTVSRDGARAQPPRPAPGRDARAAGRVAASALPADTVEEIVTRSDGVPLFRRRVDEGRVEARAGEKAASMQAHSRGMPDQRLPCPRRSTPR